MQPEDHELVRNCLTGNTKSFEELVFRYKKLVYSIVFSRIKDRHEAEDLSQEVFIRIYKSLGRYNPEYKFSTWASSIAVNICLDRLRKKKLDTIPIEEIEFFSHHNNTPEAQYFELERKELLEDAINQLPEKYRQPVILFHEKGLSYEEIMDILHEPMSIVKNRLYRARLMLRDRLEPIKKEEAL